MECREKTDSVTKLVKIIANEVLNERIKELQTQRVVIQADEILADEILAKIAREVSTDHVGEGWTAEEDALLQLEFATAIQQIANNHKRTVYGIRARAIKNKLVENICKL